MSKYNIHLKQNSHKNTKYSIRCEQCMSYNHKHYISEVKNLNNRSHVQECSEQVHRILLEYCVNCYPNVPVSIFVSLRFVAF